MQGWSSDTTCGFNLRETLNVIGDENRGIRGRREGYFLRLRSFFAQDGLKKAV